MSAVEPPIVLGPFIVPESTVRGHDIRLIVWGAATLGRQDGEDVRKPWLRAACSCGWMSGQRSSIEDNAFHDWADHAHEAETGQNQLWPS